MEPLTDIERAALTISIVAAVIGAVAGFYAAKYYSDYYITVMTSINK